MFLQLGLQPEHVEVVQDQPHEPSSGERGRRSIAAARREASQQGYRTYDGRERHHDDDEKPTYEGQIAQPPRQRG